MQGYLAACSFADACVGVVLDALSDSQYSENTVVVLCGDHGFHIGEKDHISKLTLWEEGAQTPLIIRAPGVDGDAFCAEGDTIQRHRFEIRIVAAAGVA